ncbi:unnamed protein product [Prunus brigantina]
MECVSTVTYNVIVNGEATRHILPSRGLRHGDPLSPFLFLLCVEGLSAMIKKHEEMGALQGFRFHPQGGSISHLFFADDSVIFCKADEREARCLKNILVNSEKGSGQCINFDKSSLLFGKKCHARVQKQVGEILQVQQKDGFGRYLGLTADFGVSKQQVFEELPINLCKEIEREIIRYWWKGHKEHKGIHWVGWHHLSMMKEAWGMGFRDLRCFNLAMLAKIGWRIIQYPDSLLATTYRDKYFRSSDFMSAGGGHGTSWGWKGILQGRKILEVGMRWRIGNEHQVRTCRDKWVPSPSSFKIYSRHPEIPVLVQGLIDHQTKMWNRDLIL